MVHQPCYRDKNGKKRKRRKWYAAVPDPHIPDRWNRIPTFEVKRSAERFERNARKLVDVRRSGDRPEDELARWLDTLTPDLRAKLAKLRLVDPIQERAGRTIEEHLDAFAAHLRARGTTPKHVVGQVARVRRALVEEAGFVALAELEPGPVRAFLERLREGTEDRAGASATTLNGYRQAIRQFTKWGRREGLLASDPFEHLEVAKGEKAIRRRALSEEEIGKLLRATAAEPERYGMDGPTRALLYRTALESGLRLSELANLRRDDLDLDAEQPTLVVRSAFAKNRREVTLPLRPDLAVRLRGHLAVHAAGRVFPAMLDLATDAAAMLREDLAAAEVPHETADGRVDFHSLRHTMVSRCARSGLHPKVTQTLARHSTAQLTLDVYSHLDRSETAAAIESLPSLEEAAG